METNKKKRIIIISVISAVIVVIVAAFIAISVNKEAIQYNLIYNVLPDSVEGTVEEDTAITIYKRKNPDFNFKTDDNPYNLLQFYYYDENGEEVVVNGADKLVYNGEEYGAPIGDFVLQASEEIAKINRIINAVIALIVVLIVVGLIALWFIIWSKKQDEEKEKKFGKKNLNSRNSKGNKKSKGK